jgi:hypothetical protein
MLTADIVFFGIIMSRQIPVSRKEKVYTILNPNGGIKKKVSFTKDPEQAFDDMCKYYEIELNKKKEIQSKYDALINENQAKYRKRGNNQLWYEVVGDKRKCGTHPEKCKYCEERIPHGENIRRVTKHIESICKHFIGDEATKPEQERLLSLYTETKRAKKKKVIREVLVDSEVTE